MKNICLITIWLLQTALCLYADTSIDCSPNRILYCRNQLPGLRQNFVVLDKITDSGLLQCHVLGTQRQLQLKPDQVTVTCFFAHSSDFMITQYALYNYANHQADNYALALAIYNGDQTGRINRLLAYEQAVREFTAAVKKIKNLPRDSWEPADQLDALLELLEQLTITDHITQAAASHDWILAIAMWENYQRVLPQTASRAFPGTTAAGAVHEQLQNYTGKLLGMFCSQLQLPNARRQIFLKHFPAARGLWSEAIPRNRQMLRRFFERSMQSYFQLEDLSSIVEPQDWGSAMLEVLMLTESIPGANELEEEFDNAMRQLEKVLPGNNK